MKYENVIEGIFKVRPNRFVAQIYIKKAENDLQSSDSLEANVMKKSKFPDDYELVDVHVKNTGRCEELLIEGVKVILEKASNPERKTKYDLISVYREDYGWINIDSQAPNQLVKDWLSKDNEVFSNISYVKPEYKFGSSRIDFYLEEGTGEEAKKILIEVKGCTLVKYGIGLFPDAPTDRGVKHLRELTEASKDGFSCYIAFVIQVNNVKYVLPNRQTQPEFATALADAIRAGVKILYLYTNVTENQIDITGSHIISHL